MFFPWENFDVVPAGKLRRAEKERDGLREKAKKAQKEAAEADRLSRLAKFKQMATGPDVSRWFLIDGEWRWHSWDPGQRKLVDTGLRPGKHGTGFPPDEVTVCRHCGAYE
jgi:hypothetical protein